MVHIGFTIMSGLSFTIFMYDGLIASIHSMTSMSSINVSSSVSGVGLLSSGPYFIRSHGVVWHSHSYSLMSTISHWRLVFNHSAILSVSLIVISVVMADFMARSCWLVSEFFYCV